MNSEADFRYAAKVMRLRLSLDEDRSQMVTSRPRGGYSRGKLYFHGKNKIALTCVGMPPARSNAIFRYVSDIGVDLELVQGSPPGEWVGIFHSDYLGSVALRLGMVKKRKAANPIV